jgi:hypothetical protein
MMRALVLRCNILIKRIGAMFSATLKRFDQSSVESHAQRNSLQSLA